MFAEELVKIYILHTFDSVGREMSTKKNPRARNYEEKSIQIVNLVLAGSHGDKMALERGFLAGLDMNMGDYDKRTALHLACSEGHLGYVKFLIETCKVNIDMMDRWGFTPLGEAKKSNNMQIVTIIMKFISTDFKIQIEKPIIEEYQPNSESSSNTSKDELALTEDEQTFSTNINGSIE